MHLRRDSKSYQILKYTFLSGGFLILAGIGPAGGAQLTSDLVKIYFRNRRFEKEKFLRDLRNLQSRDLVNYRELPNGNINITLTNLGKKIELSYNLENIKLDTKKTWDGKWRMIIFDIPEHKKNGRNALRQKLSQLQFYPIQKSVFITPYNCEKEIEFICATFEVRKYVLLFIVSSFEGEEKIKHYFNL